MSIQLIDVKKFFGTPPTEVLKGIDLEIEEGQFVALTGKSGSGKSTLLYIVSTLDNPSSGDVKLYGESVPKMSSQRLHQFRNEKMGFVFQFHYLLPELSALENVLMPTRKTKVTEASTGYAKDLLKEFGLESKMNRLPRQLSGGEQQRVAIARSLIMKPRYIFADEPTGNLDSVNGEIVLNIFKKINQEMKTTIIMVTHDPDFAKLATRQVFLVDGKTVK